MTGAINAPAEDKAVSRPRRRGREATFQNAGAFIAPENNMKEIEVDAAQLQSLIRDTLESVLREQAGRETGASASGLSAPASRPVAGHVLVAVCCGDCLRPETQAALDELRRAGFVLIEPGAHELKDKATRERLISKSDAILLPAVGDDDAAKMALGIFDEPVARTALAALSLGKPLIAAMHSPYDAALKVRVPVLRAVWEGYRRTLSSFGFNVVEAAEIAATVQSQIAPRAATSQAPKPAANGRRAVVTAEDIDRASRDGKMFQSPPGALITPLARDRARELGVLL